MSNNAVLIEAFGSARPLYGDFVARLQSLVGDLLEARQVRVHTVSGRAKTVDSFIRKVASADGRYAALSAITDLAGLRIITFFASDVDRVADVIRDEFNLIPEHSVDKRAALASNAFGYLSRHQVVRLAEKRAVLPEYARFKELFAEIQIRTVLQHAWAEIEHDLGYKTEATVPEEARREFARIAGLLETADGGFLRLRDQLQAYEARLPARLESEAASIPVDQASLAAFLRASPLVAGLNDHIAGIAGGTICVADDAIISRHVGHLQILGIRTIGQLELALKKEVVLIEQFASAWLTPPSTVRSALLPLVFLEYILLARSSDPNLPRIFFNATDIHWSADFWDLLKGTYEGLKQY